MQTGNGDGSSIGPRLRHLRDQTFRRPSKVPVTHRFLRRGKNLTLLVASLYIAVGLAAVPAYAQRGGVQARVPFNFAVSEKIFPAGEYTMIARSHQVRIEDAKGRLIAMVLANDISGRSTGERSDHLPLLQLWSPAQETGRQLLTSRTEADLAKEERGKYFAVLGEKR